MSNDLATLIDASNFITLPQTLAEHVFTSHRLNDFEEYAVMDNAAWNMSFDVRGEVDWQLDQIVLQEMSLQRLFPFGSLPEVPRR